MCLWRLSVALALGLWWYFSGGGFTATHCGVLCVTLFLLSRFYGNIKRDSGTQTDEERKEAPLQETVKEDLSHDVPDGNSREQVESLQAQYPRVKKSLQRVFECAYAQLILPWYSVPEPLEQQPLHQMLSKEFDFVINRIIEKGRDFDVRQVAVGSVRILTQHLHNAKQPEREFLFCSRADEVAVLREFSDSLVRNLFSRSLWGQELNHCALTEIFAVKVLDLLVTWLSDPDNLNQLVVSQFDGVTSKASSEDLCGSDRKQAALAPQEGQGDGGEGGFQEPEILTRIKGKSRGQRLKNGFSKFVNKIKPNRSKKKKMKVEEQDSMFRMIGTLVDARMMLNENDGSSREGSIHSQQDSDREDSDPENYLTSPEKMMEVKLSYKMWCVGQWAVSIPQVDMEVEALIFTVHLEENFSPENLQWDIRKTYMDVIQFRNRLEKTFLETSQDISSLPTILKLEESEINDEDKEKVRASVHCFLQALLSDNLIRNTQHVFDFFCPLDKLLDEEDDYGGAWGLLGSLAYFLMPGQDEEENCSPQTETPKEIIMPPRQPESTALPSENCGVSTENGHDVTGASLPAIVISHCDPPSDLPEDGEINQEPQLAVNPDPSRNEACFRDRTENSDDPSHFKSNEGLPRSRSQESLVSTKESSDEDRLVTDCTSERSRDRSCLGGSVEDLSGENKKEKKGFRRFGGANKVKVKEQSESKPRGEATQCQKGPDSLEQLEATKAIFDLLKEISGNSFIINMFDAILKPFMPIVKRKVNSFLNTINPTEEQMADYINTMRNKQWSEFQPAAPPPLPRTDEEKNETRERAHSLINARYSKYHILKKTDMDSVFNLFQKSAENKTLIYMLLSFLLKECFPNDQSLNARAAALLKGTKILY